MLDERHHRFLTAQLQWQGRTVTFYGAHPHPPLAPRWAQSRNDELQTIMMQVRQEANPHVLLGDLNAAPWSSVMRQLFGQTRLRHASLGFGMFPTWRYKTWLIAAPLDHILVSNEWQVRFYAPGAFVGSDHLPVLAQLHLLE
jgi:endonuclease/exonuclease/phosphatase (EEP) superfamily protein YafD